MTTHTVVSYCDLTGNTVRPWAEAGHDCLCIDTQHSIRAIRTVAVGRGSITYQWGDVRSREPLSASITFAFPPCTDLAVSGARDFATKGLRRFIDALEVVEACRLLCVFGGGPWMLENPVGRLSTAWRKPDHTFDPCDYGDPYTKKTCLWTGGGSSCHPRPALPRRAGAPCIGSRRVLAGPICAVQPRWALHGQCSKRMRFGSNLPLAWCGLVC